MLFNSYVFILFFLPVTLFFYFGLNKIKKYEQAKIFLTGMSLFFYGYFNIKYIYIIISSIIINYIFSHLIQNKKNISKYIMIFAICCNLALLFYYKYYDFFINNINYIFKTNLHLKNILIPLGISFFTFQQISYIVDSYKNKEIKYSFIDYSLFVSFFPQLIAGPIILHSEIIPQFKNKELKKFSSKNFSIAIYGFSLGLAKKILLADAFGRVVNYGYSDIYNLSTLNTIIIIFAYTLQLYLDFSAYGDMAKSIALMFNIDVEVNFNSPFKASNIIDFWKKWHITLTKFFRTYIYFPLGGNKFGEFRTAFNQFIVFFLSGLWHGANYTFIIWGVLNGLAIIFVRKINKIVKTKIYAVGVFLTLVFWTVSLIFFRSNTVNDAITVLSSLFNFRGFVVDAHFYNLLIPVEINTIFSLLSIDNLIQKNLEIVIAVIFFVMFFALIKLKNIPQKMSEFKPSLIHAAITAVLLVWSIISFSGVSTFLYFNF